MDLPAFRFHPDPVRSGSVAPSAAKCRCCGQARGWIYQAAVYAEKNLEAALCPWCIADGRAHRKFDATFVDSEALAEGTADALRDEIVERTPGFDSYQSERWLSCCGEPAAFVGPMGIAEIRESYRELEGELMMHIVHEHGISGGAARTMLERLSRDESPTAFVFRCRTCTRPLAYVDYV